MFSDSAALWGEIGALRSRLYYFHLKMLTGHLFFFPFKLSPLPTRSAVMPPLQLLGKKTTRLSRRWGLLMGISRRVCHLCGVGKREKITSFKL